MSRFPGYGYGGWLGTLSIALGPAALAWKIHPALFWVLVAALVAGITWESVR